jgi:hypothetical protein
MPPLRQHRIAALQLSQGARPQHVSGREVRLRAQGAPPSPDRLSAQELQPDFLHRQTGARLAPASMRLCSRGRRCFLPHVRQHDWHPLARLRAQTAHRLPALLRRAEGAQTCAAGYKGLCSERDGRRPLGMGVKPLGTEEAALEFFRTQDVRQPRPSTTGLLHTPVRDHAQP